MPSDGPPGDGHPAGEAIHATAVAIGGAGLLILGPSGAGKSRLAAALIEASTRHRPIRLVGDDRVLLTRSREGLTVRGHPRIQGFIERRGLGIVATVFVETAPVRGLVLLGPTTARSDLLQNFPSLALVIPQRSPVLCAPVLQWWRDASTTQGAKRSAAA